MGAHSHEPVTVDPQSLKESQNLWHGFTKLITIGVVLCSITLLLMAFFLV